MVDEVDGDGRVYKGHEDYWEVEKVLADWTGLRMAQFQVDYVDENGENGRNALGEESLEKRDKWFGQTSKTFFVRACLRIKVFQDRVSKRKVNAKNLFLGLLLDQQQHFEKALPEMISNSDY